MIKVTLKDGSVREYEVGISIDSIVKSISHQLHKEALIAKVNDKFVELSTPLYQDASLEIYKWEDDIGKSTFWHSSSHIMAEAIMHFYPKAKLGFGPAIENGFYYDMDLNGEVLTEEMIKKIEEKFMILAAQKNVFTKQNISKDEALSYYTVQQDNPYKRELIGSLEDGKITFYTQGTFTDLCKGPHIPQTNFVKAFKIMSIAGAYWRGDEKNKMLTRLYGISFPSKKELDQYLMLLSEAKKRDHRKIGKALELFTFSEKVGMGLPLWLPKGAVLRERLQTFLQKIQLNKGYQPVVTPHIGHKDLYVTSGHYDKYGQDSFQPIHTPQEGESFFLKPMNCPHHCEIYKSQPRSYKDLPLRLAEFGTVYRYEQHGELHGLTRVRGFTQDDAHLFCRPEQVKEEFAKVIDLVLFVFRSLDFQEYTAQISLRDKVNRSKYIGAEQYWSAAEKAIVEASQEKDLDTVIAYGEAAFYGPKLDFMVKDAIGRKWQLGTIQVDYNLPERFALEYIDTDNSKQRPVMIHRAPFGSLERFLALLIEHTAGKFPLWLAPTQVTILPISENFLPYANQVNEQLKAADVRTIVDSRNEKINKKIREAELLKIPYMIIIGEEETHTHTVSFRKQGHRGDRGKLSVIHFVQKIVQEGTFPSLS